MTALPCLMAAIQVRSSAVVADDPIAPSPFAAAAFGRRKIVQVDPSSAECSAQNVEVPDSQPSHNSARSPDMVQNTPLPSACASQCAPPSELTCTRLQASMIAMCLPSTVATA